MFHIDWVQCEHDAADVKRQSFFKNIVWEDLLTKKTKPPFVPTVVCIHFNRIFIDNDRILFSSEVRMMFLISMLNLHQKNLF